MQGPNDSQIFSRVEADTADYGQAVAASAAELEIARKRVQDMEKTHQTKQEAASKVSNCESMKFYLPFPLHCAVIYSP